jgi:hypothetical protein
LFPNIIEPINHVVFKRKNRLSAILHFVPGIDDFNKLLIFRGIRWLSDTEAISFFLLFALRRL